ncbi:hypothetical protein BC835DRAFT_1349887 [Cytidiella melzeri]|nr:hypothetical protein BC835DRAFT_1349887 [Cytidiella melzeri]
MVFGHWCVSRLSHNSQILFLLTMLSFPVCENFFGFICNFIILLFARRTLFFVLGIHPCRGLLVVANTLHLVLVLVAHPPPPRHHCCYPSPHFNFPSRLHQLPSAT